MERSEKSLIAETPQRLPQGHLVAQGPLNGLPPSPAFWQALLAAQEEARVMVRDEATDPKAGRQQWKYSKTESWIQLARDRFHPRKLLLTQAAVLEPLAASGGQAPIVPVKGKFVFTLVHVTDATGWWWAFDWPHYGELRGGPELAWRMTLTLATKYAIRGILQVPQGDEGDERESQDPRLVEGGIPTWQPGVQGYQPEQPQHGHVGQFQQPQQGYYGHAAPAQGAPQAPHQAPRGGGHGGGAFAGGGPGGVVGGQNGQAHLPPADQEPIVNQAAVMLQADQLGHAPPAQLQPQQFDQPQQYQQVQAPAPQYQQPPQGVPVQHQQQGQQPGNGQAAPPGRVPPTDGGPDPTHEELLKAGWTDPFARRLAALGPNDVCPDDLREGFLSSCNVFFGGDKTAMLAPWAGTGFTPLLKAPPGQAKPQPTGVHLRRYAVKLDWKQKAAPVAAGGK